MEFFNNKENDVLKFKINSTGIAASTIDARLIFLTSENKNYLIAGNITEDICEFKIPMLSLYEKDNLGKIVFEIISGDTYFKVWEESFKVKSKMSIIVENVISEEQKEVLNEPLKVTLIKEDKKDDIKKEKVFKKEKKLIKGFPTFDDVIN